MREGTQGLCPRTPGVLRFGATSRLGRLTLGRALNEDAVVGWRIGLRRSATRAPAGCHTAEGRADLLRPIQLYPNCWWAPRRKTPGLGAEPQDTSSSLSSWPLLSDNQ